MAIVDNPKKRSINPKRPINVLNDSSTSRDDGMIDLSADIIADISEKVNDVSNPNDTKVRIHFSS